MRKIKIVSDGLGRNTRVEDAETGEEINGVYRIAWEIDVSGIAEVQLWLYGVEVAIVGKLQDVHIEDEP